VTNFPTVTVGYDGSIMLSQDTPFPRAKALLLAHELLHAHAESRGLDAVKGIASECPSEAYIFIFGEFQRVASVLSESGERTCLQWNDSGFLNEVTVHDETELWWYVPAQS